LIYGLSDPSSSNDPKIVIVSFIEAIVIDLTTKLMKPRFVFDWESGNDIDVDVPSQVNKNLIKFSNHFDNIWQTRELPGTINSTR
jgi:hypothetical protein